jgi:hypothetical protein
MINTLTTLYSSLKSYYNNLTIYGHSYASNKLIVLKGVLDIIKELRCYSYTSNQDITDIYSIVEYIVNSSDIFKKEYAPTNNLTTYFQDVPSQFYPKGEYSIKESLVTVIANTTAFKYDGEGNVFPNQINLQAVAYNFTPSPNTPRKWEYSNGGEFKIIEGATSDNLTVTPDSALWNNTDMISMRYTVNDIYTNQLTLLKVRDGYGAYSVEVSSSNGTIFQNNKVDTELSAHVYIAGEEITDTIETANFTWKRVSDDSAGDTAWNNKGLKGKTIRITSADVKKRATFVCTVLIDGTKIMNGQVTILDQLDTTAISATMESNKSLTQLYNTEDNKLNPDWSISPYLVLTPGLWAGDTEDNLLISQKDHIKDVKWTKNGLLIENSATHVIGEDFTLTIKTNELTLNPNIRYAISGVYIDPLTEGETPFYASLSFVRVETSGVTIQAIMTYPLGSIFKNDDISYLKAHCDMWRGSYIDNTDVSYKWFIEKPGVFPPKNTTAEAKSGSNVLTLTNTIGMVRGSEIRLFGSTYRVASVNSDTQIALQSELTNDVPIGTNIVNPYYDSDGGEGWALITNENTFGGISGYTTNEITIPEGAVVNYATFKCVIRDLDSKSITYNDTVYATASFLDQQDPLQIFFDTPEGTIFKNNQGTITITAEVWRNGEELDLDGSRWIYDWIQYDQNGLVVPTFNRINKTIMIVPDDVYQKSNFEVRLRDQYDNIVAKGRITIADLIDGANSLAIYTRDMLEPAQPVGSSPAKWANNPETFDDWYGLLWQAFNINSLDGSPSGQWTPPILVDEHTTNYFFRFLWHTGTGNDGKYLMMGTNAENERDVAESPFNMPDVVWKCISTANSNIDGGFEAVNIPIYNTYTYRYSIWVKQMQKDGYITFGCDPNTMEAGTEVVSDGIFWAGDVPEINKWYLLVGYINGSEDNTGAKKDSGVWDPETGRRILNINNFKTFKYRSTDETQSYRCWQSYALGVGTEVQFWGQRMDICDNTEPSISEILKQAATGVPARKVTIQGDQMFKYKDDFKGDPIPNVIDLIVETQNIEDPEYVWRYKNESSEWTTMHTSTGKITVSPTDPDYGWTNDSIKYVTYRVDVGDYYDTHTIVKITDGINGEDGWYTDFKYALSVNMPSIQYPSGKSPGDNWTDDPPQPTGDQAVWMTKILKYPSTGEVKEGETWSTPIKITGDKGEDSYSVVSDKDYHDLITLTGYKFTINPDYFEFDKLGKTVATTYTVLKGTNALTYKADAGTTAGKNYYSIVQEKIDAGLTIAITSTGQIYPTAFDDTKANLSVTLRIYCEDSGISFLKVITWRKINEENFYLEDALKYITSIDQGLVLTTWIRLGHATAINDFQVKFEDEKAGIYGGEDLYGFEDHTVRIYSGGNLESAQTWSNKFQQLLDKEITAQEFYEYSPKDNNGATFVVRQDGSVLCYNGYFHGDIWANNGFFKGNIDAEGKIVATSGSIGNLNIYSTEEGGGFGLKDGNFYVDPDGNLTAKNANISGSLNVTEGGSVGGMVVKENYMQYLSPLIDSNTRVGIQIGQLSNTDQWGISLSSYTKNENGWFWGFSLGAFYFDFYSKTNQVYMFTGNANSLTVTDLATIKNCKIDNSLYFKTDTHTYTYDKESWEPDPTTAIWIANGAGGQKNISVPTGLPIGTVRWAISNGTSGKFGIQSAGNDKFVSEGRNKSWLVMDNAGDSVMLVKISSYQWACFPTIFTKGSFGDN